MVRVLYVLAVILVACLIPASVNRRISVSWRRGILAFLILTMLINAVLDSPHRYLFLIAAVIGIGVFWRTLPHQHG
jgi:hypothetical protein